MINAVSNPVPISNSKRSFMDTLWFLFWHVCRWPTATANWASEEVIDGSWRELKAIATDCGFFDMR
ncbi:hypothetical protein D3C76_612320 [compost metagenome]|jgi:hypothetical protein